MPPAARYHHGDLPTALVEAAIQLLEENGGEDLSLRAAARRAGVSTAAPYRHFPDRTALLSAVAAVGYNELGRDLVAACPEPETVDDLATIALAYVQFALRRSGLFRVMFTEGCDTTSPDRVAAVAAIHEYLHHIVKSVSPKSDAGPTAVAMWALVHGLAFLHLDGKLDSTTDSAVENSVRDAVRAVFTVGQTRSDS
ncbi:TetR/AcrR family transcriptional regulator [Williamsia sterculiae]|uniref:TetR/AcrR family transcriptional regulator n=1 Tax=Williamsia sterculiae TaxID=1344003 RepID=UPI0009710C67|nr:TetR/AcrR family transcriptional regulator [Williamsia sterculiae]